MNPEEQKAALLLKNGFDPAKYDLDLSTGDVYEKAETPPPAPPTPTSPVSTALHAALHHSPEAVAGLMGAAGTGAAATAGLSWLGGPVTGVPATLGIGALSLLGGGLAAAGAGKLKDELIPESVKQAEAEREAANPVAAHIGALLPQAALLRPSLSTPISAARGLRGLIINGSAPAANKAALGAIGLGAGLGAAQEIAQPLIHGEAPNLKDVALGTLEGAALHEPTKLASAITFGHMQPTAPDTTRLNSARLRMDMAKEGAEKANVPGAKIDPFEKFKARPEVQAELAKDPTLESELARYAKMDEEGREQHLAQIDLALQQFDGLEHRVSPDDAAEHAKLLKAQELLTHLDAQLALPDEHIPDAKSGNIMKAWHEALSDWGKRKFNVDTTLKPEVRGDNGEEVRGASLRRPAALAPALAEISAARATPDTYPHEIFHAVVHDIEMHGTPQEKAWLKQAADAYGGIEQLTEAVGLEFAKRQYDPSKAGILGDLAARIKEKWGKAGPADYARLGASLLENGAGTDRLLRPSLRAYGIDKDKENQPLPDDKFFRSKLQKELEKPTFLGLVWAKDGTLPVQNVIAKAKKMLPGEEAREVITFVEHCSVNGRIAKGAISPVEPDVEIRTLGGEIDPKDARFAKLQHMYEDSRRSEFESDLEYAQGLDQSSPRHRNTLEISKRKLAEYDEFKQLEKERFPNNARVRELSEKGYHNLTPEEQHEHDTIQFDDTKRPEKLHSEYKGTAVPRDDPSYVELLLKNNNSFYSAPHFSGGNNIGLLGHVRGYMETAPDGKKTFVVSELQSDQKQRWISDRTEELKEKEEQLKAVKEGNTAVSLKFEAKKNKIKNLEDNITVLKEQLKNVPRPLHNIEAMAIKTAARHAVLNGADRIVFLDADSVMHAEGHDLSAQREFANKSELDLAAKNLHPNAEFEMLDGRDPIFVIKNEDGRLAHVSYNKHQKKWNLEWTEMDFDRELASKLSKNASKIPPPIFGKTVIPTESGMRQHYDQVVPTKAEQVLETRREPYMSPHKQQRQSEIFNGDISGHAYDLTKFKEHVESGKPTLMSSNRFDYQPLGASTLTSPAPKKSFWSDPFMSEIDKLRTSGDPNRNFLAGKFKDLYNSQREMNTRYALPLSRALEGLTPQEQNNVYSHRLELDRGNPSPVTLSPKEQAANAGIQRVLTQMAVDQIASGQLIKGRKRGMNPDYMPNVAHDEVLKILAEEQGTPRFVEAQKQFVDLNRDRLMAKRGLSRQDAQVKAEEMFEKYRGAFGQGINTDPFSFGAVREHSGTHLPDSWIEPDLKTALDKYTRRFTKDRAFYDTIEKDPKAMALLGRSNYHSGQPIPPAHFVQDHLAKDPLVRGILNSYVGRQRSQTGTFDSFGRFVNSLILGGPLTRGTDFLTTPFKAIPQIGAIKTAKAIARTIGDWGNTYERSLQSGLNSADGKSFMHEVLGSNDKISGLFDALASGINTWTGSEAIEKAARTLAQGLGEYVAHETKAAALAGSAKDVAFLNKLGSDWRTATPENLGARIGRIYQGEYNATNLPSWIVDSKAAPFFSMMRWNIEQFNNFRKYALEPITNPAVPGKPNFGPALATIFAGTIGGLAIEELRQELTGRKDYNATFTELANAHDPVRATQELAGKLATAAQLTGTFGIWSEIMKQGIDVLNNRMPQGFRMPAMEVTDGNIKLAISAVKAINQGEPFDRVLPELMKQIGNNNVQLFRLLYDQAGRFELSDEAKYDREQHNFRRDQGMFNSLAGYPVNPTESSPPSLNTVTQQAFRRETDPSKMMEEAMTLRRKALARFAETGDPLEYTQSLRQFANMGQAIAPNPERQPVKFANYLNFVRASQGPEAAQRMLQSYYQRAGLGQMKAGLLK